MSAILLATIMALAAPPPPEQPIAVPRVTISPREAPSGTSPRSRPMLPFENGHLVVTMRAWTDGAMQCSATGTGPGFVTTAATLCEDTAWGGPGSVGEGEPVLVMTLVFAIVPDGAVDGLATDWPGRRLFDSEAQIDVAPDGAIVACTALRDEGDSGFAFGGRRLCDDVRRGPPAIHAALAGTGPRRGRLRVMAFAEGAAADHFSADNRR